MSIFKIALLCLPLLAIVCSAAPVQAPESQTVIKAIDTEWPMTPEYVIRDDIQAYYENTVDEVLSVRSEDILNWLATTVNSHSTEQTLRPQAKLMGLDDVHDACLTMMPGFVAKHINQINTRLYAAVEPSVNEFLPQLWPDYAQTNQMTDLDAKTIHPEIASSLYSLNQAIGSRLMEITTEYNLSEKIVDDMNLCNAHSQTETASTDLWMYVAKLMAFPRLFRDQLPNPRLAEESRLASSFSDTNNGSFIDIHLKSVYSSLWFEFDNRMNDLFSTIQRDLVDGAIEA
ncbi:hypothetical protein J3Q64DRAFT_1851960 [Phycomyces blakesleeanus]|uniref:Uncharacterized protein n=2 Tax=Phycomyces blakesleeanus TaxID=4837 RepID=A0A162PP70_PHYB8|nr:hypothetical protein PHYBLDRAFT_76614 [Phycomyces blakesleeanus NRRL 1555(-)]OAD74677.1 hypothetical protein PHYBLDRAFT_76614 [Phycomyces blakesleeanus NRRL 1555(-)]|eukprot:XP_018292717.1 hypothetical protein PHYBLDRAFT_76614 [Phycomyces blakesleeanus NRRL 1555(-)]